MWDNIVTSLLFTFGKNDHLIIYSCIIYINIYPLLLLAVVVGLFSVKKWFAVQIMNEYDNFRNCIYILGLWDNLINI